jgi:hypothetical protein
MTAKFPGLNCGTRPGSADCFPSGVRSSRSRDKPPTAQSDEQQRKPLLLTAEGYASIPPAIGPGLVIVGAALMAVLAAQIEVNKIATDLKNCVIMDPLSDLQC